MSVSFYYRLQANFTLFQFWIRKICFENIIMNPFVRILGLNFSDLKFIIEFDQFDQITMCFGDQILKVNWQFLILIRKLNTHGYQLCFLCFPLTLIGWREPWEVGRLYKSFIYKSVINPCEGLFCILNLAFIQINFVL